MTSFSILSHVTTVQSLLASEVGYVARGGDLITVGNSISMADESVLMVSGDVFSSSASAVVVASTARITNTGTLSAFGFNGVIASASSMLAGPHLSLLNTGSILGIGSGTDGILMNAGDNRIVNYGTISSTGDDGIQIAAGDTTLSLDTNFISNYGTISGIFGIAISNTVTDTILNSGTISSLIGGTAIELTGAGADRLVNTGLILGDVIFGTGNDTLDARGGHIEGSVTTGLGNDLILVDDARLDLLEGNSAGSDTIRAWVDFELGANFEVLEMRGGAVVGTGNALNNTITGTHAANVISGADGNDSLVGQGGADAISGDAGDDSLEGGLGADTLLGGIGADSMISDEGRDLLDGGTGIDRMNGGRDADTLIGGEGADSLTGGAGEDTFVFLALGDSTVAAAGRDRIIDFVLGEDVIDLSALDANSSTAADDAFVRVSAFSHAAGQLVVRTVGANCLVEGDVNGDGVADFSIQVMTVTTLAVGDLVL